MASPLVQGSKLRDQLSPDQPIGLTPRPSAKAQCVARPTLNTSQPHNLIYVTLYRVTRPNETFRAFSNYVYIFGGREIDKFIVKHK